MASDQAWTKPDESVDAHTPTEQMLLYARDLAHLATQGQFLARRLTAAPEGNSPAILIADDEPGVRMLISATLDGHGFRILHAADGPEAIAVALAHRPRLVLLDVDMPRLNGLEVCRWLRTEPDLEGMVVIMLTGTASPSHEAAGLAAGADQYLTKPFSPMQLLRLVELAMAIPRRFEASTLTEPVRPLSITRTRQRVA